jgi:predicted O-linked N-acetylglucosamine transferase (SPINDLY family)
VLARRPDQADALNLLGVIHSQSGRHDEAVASLARACAVDPRVAAFHSNLGTALLEGRRLEEAEASFREAVELDRAFADAHAGLAKTLWYQGRTAAAAAAYARGAREARDPALAVSGALLVPVIPESVAEIAVWRARVASETARLAADPPRIEDPLRRIELASFFLAYHGEPNAALQRGIARLIGAACPQLAWTAPHCRSPRAAGGRIRVGFISKFFRDHSIARTSLGLIERLARERFEAIAIAIPPAAGDAGARAVRAAADRWVALPPGLEAARAAIAALELDVLFYQDIGMEPVSYLLSFSRLAPVQCVSFGHPDTTGVPTLDWFVSSALYEPDGAAAHYTERLHLVPDAGTLAYYRRPRLDGAPGTRAALGLPADARVYACPQAPFKFHPAFDAVLAGILQRDPRGVLLVVDSHPHWGRLLRARLERAIPACADRVRFVAPLPHAEFLRLLQLADVVLDPPHFNGMNTSLEALALGTPVVTWPGTLQRARHGLGLYRRMGVDDCVVGSAAAYVETAVRIAGDAALQATLRARLRDRAAALFEDDAVVRGFEAFFERAVADARAAPAGRAG